MDVAASLGHKEMRLGQPNRHVRCYAALALALALCIWLGSGRAGGLIHIVPRGKEQLWENWRRRAVLEPEAAKEARIGAMAA
jgi:hypothetical protein